MTKNVDLTSFTKSHNIMALGETRKVDIFCHFYGNIYLK